MGVFEVMLVLGGTLYATALIWLYIGVRRPPHVPVQGRPSVAVVVAARNEEHTIGRCLAALKAQDYEGPFEVVVVDDRSEDRTAQRAAEHAWPALRVVRAPANPTYRCPKKSALAAGIAQTQADLLLFTDADCQPPPDWVRRTAGRFAPEVGMVIGHAFPPRPATLLQHLLALDNLAVGVLGAGSTGMGRPLSCTGRNLAYRRRVYDEVGGFAAIGHWVGGDDVFFMRLVSRTKWRCVASPAWVACDPGPDSWRGALQQKLRHAAKAGRYRGPALLLGAAVYGFHGLLALGLVRLLSGEANATFAAVWAGRWLADGLVLARYAALSGQQCRFWALPFFEVVYIPYVLLFTLAGRLGWFRWK